MAGKKEREPGCKFIYVQARIQRALHICQSIGQGKGDLLHRGAAGLAHVIPGDGNRVPLRNILLGVGEHVGNNPHRLLRWIDVGPARNVFLQNIVLHRATKLTNVFAGAPRHRNIERQQNGRGGIDGHGCRNLLQINAGKQALHVFDGVNGHAYPAHLAHGHGMIRVHADLCGQVEGH